MKQTFKGGGGGGGGGVVNAPSYPFPLPKWNPNFTMNLLSNTGWIPSYLPNCKTWVKVYIVSSKIDHKITYKNLFNPSMKISTCENYLLYCHYLWWLALCTFQQPIPKNLAFYSMITSITLQSLFNVVLAELIRIALLHPCCV